VGDVTGLEDEGPGVEASQLIGEVAEAVVLPGWRRWWCWNTAPVGRRGLGRRKGYDPGRWLLE